MQGGCFSISNLGGIGGTYFTPIVNAPEVAILGISRARMEPVYDKEPASSCRASCCRCRCPTITASIDGADGIRLPALGRPRRSSSRSFSRSRAERLQTYQQL